MSYHVMSCHSSFLSLSVPLLVLNQSIVCYISFKPDEEPQTSGMGPLRPKIGIKIVLWRWWLVPRCCHQARVGSGGSFDCGGVIGAKTLISPFFLLVCEIC